MFFVIVSHNGGNSYSINFGLIDACDTIGILMHTEPENIATFTIQRYSRIDSELVTESPMQGGFLMT